MPNENNESFDKCFQRWEQTMKKVVSQNNKSIERKLPSLKGVMYVNKGDTEMVNKNDFIEATTKHLHEKQKNNIIFRYLWKGGFITKLPANVKSDVMYPENDVEFLKMQFKHELQNAQDNNLVDSAILHEILNDELNSVVNLLHGAFGDMELDICSISCTGFPYTFSYWFGELGVGNMLIRGHTFEGLNGTIEVKLDASDPTGMSASMLKQMSNISAEELRKLNIVAYLQYTTRTKKEILPVFHDTINAMVQTYRENSRRWILSNYTEQYQYKPDDRFESWYANPLKPTGNQKNSESSVGILNEISMISLIGGESGSRSGRTLERPDKRLRCGSEDYEDQFEALDYSHLEDGGQKQNKKKQKQKDEAKEKKGAGGGRPGMDRNGRIRGQRTRDDNTGSHIESSGGWMAKSKEISERNIDRKRLLSEANVELKFFHQLNEQEQKVELDKRESTWKDSAESIATCTKIMSKIREANIDDIFDSMKKAMKTQPSKQQSNEMKKLNRIIVTKTIEDLPEFKGELSRKKLDKISKAAQENSNFYQKTLQKRDVKVTFIEEYKKFIENNPKAKLIEGQFATWWMWVCREAKVEYNVAWFWVMENEIEDLQIAIEGESVKEESDKLKQKMQEKKDAYDEFLRKQIEDEMNIFENMRTLNQLQEQMFVSWCSTPMWQTEEYIYNKNSDRVKRYVCIGELYTPFKNARQEPYIPFGIDREKKRFPFPEVKDFAKMLAISEPLLISRIFRLVAEKVEIKIMVKYRYLLNWKPRNRGDQLPIVHAWVDEKTGSKMKENIPKTQWTLINNGQYYRKKANYFFHQQTLSQGYLDRQQCTTQIAKIMDNTSEKANQEDDAIQKRNWDYQVQKSNTELQKIFENLLNQKWSIDITQSDPPLTDDEYKKHFFEVQEFYHKGRGSQEWRSVLEEVESQKHPCLEFIATTEARIQNLTVVLTEINTIATSLKPNEVENVNKTTQKFISNWFSAQTALFDALGHVKEKDVITAWNALEDYAKECIEWNGVEEDDPNWEEFANGTVDPTLIGTMQQAFKIGLAYLKDKEGKSAAKQTFLSDIFTSSTSVSKRNIKKYKFFNMQYWIEKGIGEINQNYNTNFEWIVECPNTEQSFIHEMVNCRYRKLTKIDKVMLSRRSNYSLEEVNDILDDLQKKYLESQWNIIFGNIKTTSSSSRINPFLIVLQ